MKTIAAALVASVFVAAHAQPQQDSPAVQHIVEDKMKGGVSFAMLFGPAPTISTATVSAAPVVLPVGGGFVGNHMPGWIDPATAGSRFFDFPGSQLGNAVYIPTWNIAPNSFMRMWCTDDVKVQKCDVYVNVYKCSGCEVGLNEDFSNYLVTNGWTPSQCGPKFISDAGEESHKFMTYRKQLANNQLERIEIDSNVRLMFASMSSRGRGLLWVSRLTKCEPRDTQPVQRSSTESALTTGARKRGCNSGGGGLAFLRAAAGGCNNCALSRRRPFSRVGRVLLTKCWSNTANKHHGV